ncbi:CvfB family protein [Alkalithermobacter paradoxus]|uniref:S1 motif domain-containing protein n=1 Tax=Alkalithermobacter paradoxus TaxID=29349 RepID=A0A1V4I8R3_9FIRM|nr:hypothetical protein CLOTH_07920 [[Clostridium] thermoalcaliphilum]
MVKIGDFNELKIKREVDFGVYLDGGDVEILLPRKYVPKEAKIDDVLKVFIYKDSEDRIIATTLAPKAKVGDFAYLKVNDVNKYGAFLDWGLEKDLLVPYGQQKLKMEKGRSYIVRVHLDKVTQRILATTKISKFLEYDEILLNEGDEVDILVCDFNDIGIGAIIDNKYYGMLYRNEVYKNLRLGDKEKAYVKKIRPDGKIDLTLRRRNYEEIDMNKDKIMEKLSQNDGFIPLNDKSSPEEIKKEFNISKRNFKDAVGRLYKEGKIELKENGICIKQ